MRKLQEGPLHEDCIQHATVGGGGSVQVWDAFHIGWRSQLVILDHNVIGAVYLIFAENFCYQDDNTPTHRAKVVRDFMEQECVTVL